jgi:uncharacterized protein YfaS (alpha-2-macroglobulin family)
MFRLTHVRLWSIVVLFAGVVGVSLLHGAKEPPAPQDREAAQKLLNEGNYNDAYQKFRALCLNEANDPKAVAIDLTAGVTCLRNLGRVNEFDEFVEATIKVHAGNWRLRQQAANEYLNIEHYGFLIGGKYDRGPNRGGGKMVNSTERDRVRALQLLTEAIPLAQKDDDKPAVANFFIQFSQQLLSNRGYTEAWRLQYLSNLAELPDYEEGFYVDHTYNGAPVDGEGKPVFHHAPKSWDDAKTDGERWRWALDQAVENDPSKLNTVRWTQAEFYQNQFGPESMNYWGYGRFFGLPVSDDDTKKDESGTYALHTLKESETIAKLATGIKRFDLPDEFNYVVIFQKIAAEPKTGYGDESLHTLAQAFENRRQYPKAATYWKQSIEKYGAGDNNWKKQRLEQIEGNWGRFEPVMTQPAGEGATVEYRYRNAKKVAFEASAIKIDELLADVKAYLKGDPGQLQWEKMNVQDIGYRLVQQGEKKYVGDQVAKWNLDLEPREEHFDKRITITTPLQKAGAYLVTATLPDGNVSKIVLWVADTAIVHKQLSDKHYYFVADAAAGTPVANANLEFFGYKQEHLGGNRFRIVTKNFAENADKDGQATPDGRDLNPEYQWLITARTKGESRLAWLGFTGAWVSPYYDAEYNTVRVFGITDRPVYRPDNKVQFKFWIRRAQYDQEDVSDFAKKTAPVEIYNPKGEKISTQTLETDDYGGIVGEYQLPKDAPLGVYSINVQCAEKNQIVAGGGNTFRVEEYKKPEFEVTIEAPKEPVMLGEKITAKVQAKYYFGSPVTSAKVKYKVMRTDHSQTWYPHRDWDWCYSPGYWWFAYDYHWYPGFERWAGCMRPTPWWWHQGPTAPPEVVAEQEVAIGADGTIEIEIDTQVAKELHGNTDHSYSITAEVRDESRRTIVGTGNVLVARKPFKIFTWVGRGYYRVGDTVQANFLAQTLDNQPVEGVGELTLLKITYDKNAQPIETPVRRWDVNTNVEGKALQQIKASAKGQYRLAYTLSDKKDHKIEGGYLFTVIGDGFDGQDYRFNSVELIPEKAEYAPGEKIKLQINTNKADATVLLFVRPANGIYLAPKVIRLKGKSTVEEIDVAKKDMPNFFVEAMTVSDAQVHSELKEIVVPPEKRILNVEVLPSSKEFKPGEEATVKVHVTDHTGENYIGSTVVTVYDKAVEYVSGGSNVPDIKEFFWKWRRQHNPSHQTSLAKGSQNIVLPNAIGMGNLGVFGETVADEMAQGEEKLGADFDTGGAIAGVRFAGGSRGGLGGAAEFSAQAKGAPADNFNALSDAPAPLEAPAAAEGLVKTEAAGDPGAPAPMLQAPTVRTNFADTALWAGALLTDKSGIAEVKLKMPENLTGWKIKVWSMGHGTRVGSGEAEVVTRKNLILRLQAPRFFVQKDEVVLSANVHNYLKTDKEVTVELEIPGNILEASGPLSQKVMVKAGAEQRVDWRVKVASEGEATVRMKALTDEESDAMEMKLPSYVHGMLKMEAWAGTVRRDQDSAKVTINVPAERRVEQSVLEIRYSPTLAGAMVDALPYMAEFPYGCTEQTLNRFLPSVITQKVLREMNLDLAAIGEKRTNLNAQEIGDDRERAKQWKRFDRNPVFEEEELNRMVKEGLTALTNMQCADGGWGWFSGWGEQSYPHTTAVVVHGLQVAAANDQALVPGVLERGVEWLKQYQARELQKIKNAPGKVQPWKDHADDLDAFTYMILVDAGQDNAEMRDFLYRDRTKIGVYSKAMFGLALHKVKDQEKLDMILKNIGQFLVQDSENETAYLKLPADNYWWYWYGSEIEANAYYLKLLSLTNPKGNEPARLVKYLLNNRKHATYWNSTRDTALCVEAFSDYIRASGENKPDMVVEVLIDGEKRKEVSIKAEDLFTFDNKLVLTGEDVKDGKHEIELRRKGEGPLYFNAYLTNFTLEDDIKKAGLEIKVERKYYLLKRVDKTVKVEGQRGQAIDQKVEKFERVPLDNLATLKSGDMVEIELEFESKNDYEYILFEDMKPAGFEPAEVRSGYSNNGLGAYMELRDNRVAFFVRVLSRGKNSIAYRMRAETPGQFAALPAKVSAMYAPELKGNSDEIKLKVED